MRIVTAAAAVSGGLLAGVYVAFSVSVMPALRRVDDPTFVTTMNKINQAIQNPLFFLLFFGAPVLAVAAAVRERQGQPSGWVVAAVVLVVVATLVTIAANVPLNDRLAADGPVDAHAARATFETAWVRWHTVRTVLHTASFGALVVALAR